MNPNGPHNSQLKKTLNAIGSKNWLIKKVKITRSRYPKQVSYKKTENRCFETTEATFNE